MSTAKFLVGGLCRCFTFGPLRPTVFQHQAVHPLAADAVQDGGRAAAAQAPHRHHHPEGVEGAAAEAPLPTHARGRHPDAGRGQGVPGEAAGRAAQAGRAHHEELHQGLHHPQRAAHGSQQASRECRPEAVRSLIPCCVDG